MCKVELRECFKIQNDTADCQQTVFYALTVDLKNLTVKFANLTVRFRCLANKLWNLTVTFLNLTVRFEHSPEKPSYLPAMQSADRWRMLLLKAIYETLTKVSSCCD